MLGMENGEVFLVGLVEKLRSGGEIGYGELFRKHTSGVGSRGIILTVVRS